MPLQLCSTQQEGNKRPTIQPTITSCGPPASSWSCWWQRSSFPRSRSHRPRTHSAQSAVDAGYPSNFLSLIDSLYAFIISIKNFCRFTNMWTWKNLKLYFYSFPTIYTIYEIRCTFICLSSLNDFLFSFTTADYFVRPSGRKSVCQLGALVSYLVHAFSCCFSELIQKGCDTICGLCGLCILL